jgi:hypothetical protein
VISPVTVKLDPLTVAAGHDESNIDPPLTLTHEEVILQAPTMSPPQAAELAQVPPPPPPQPEYRSISAQAHHPDET